MINTEYINLETINFVYLSLEWCTVMLLTVSALSLSCDSNYLQLVPFIFYLSRFSMEAWIHYTSQESDKQKFL